MKSSPSPSFAHSVGEPSPIATPLVSVVIPTKNRSALLSRSVISILNQTYQDIEIIIVDDGSTDDTPELVANLSKRDSRIVGMRNETSLGGGAARNVGISAAKGEYTAFLDDDDEWHPRKLERQVPFAGKYSMVGCRRTVAEGLKIGGIRIRRKKRHLTPQVNAQPHTSSVSLNDFYLDADISPTVVLTKTTYLQTIGGFDPALVASQGRDLFIRLAKRFGPAVMVEECLATHHVEHGLHRISDSPAHLRGGWQEFEKHIDDMPPRARKWREYTLCLREAKYSHGFGESARWFIRAVKCLHLPWSLRYGKLFALTLLTQWGHRHARLEDGNEIGS